jgi:hypothetical protein
MKKLAIGIFSFLTVLIISCSDNENNSTAPSNVNLTSGLIAFYPFNGNANDESGNGNNGVVLDATLTADRNGNLNSAYNFNGVNSCIRTMQSNSLSLNGDFSISLWFYDVPDSQLYHTFLGKRAGGNWSYNLATSINTNGVPSELNKIFTGRRYNNGAQQEYRFSGDTFNFNTWQHIVLTVQNNFITFYKNGIPMGTNNDGAQFTIPMIDQPAGLTIGSNGINTTTGTGEWMNGKLDEIRIYNRLLNRDEINYLFQN